jgi:hypothetical protein
MKLVRLEKRLLCSDLVQVRSENNGWEGVVEALLEDISADGACLQLSEPLPLNAKVQLVHEDVRFTGIVKYCHYREIGYFVGLQFDTASRWSSAAYEPMHLLDPSVLARRK